MSLTAPSQALLRGPRIPPSTLSYVLGLVRRSYLPPNRPFHTATLTSNRNPPNRLSDHRDAAALKPFNRSHLSSSSSSAIPSSRHASSAHAVLQYDPPDYHTPSPPAVITHDHHPPHPPISPPLSHPLPRLPLELPKTFRKLQRHTAGSFKLLFESHNFVPLHFANPRFLEQVTLIFLRSGEPSTWAWLSGQLGHMISDLGAGAETSEMVEFRSMAKALRAYALTELDQWDYARREIAGTDWCAFGSMGIKHGLRGLVFAKLNNWDSAREEISRSIGRWTPTGSKAYSPLDIQMLDAYIDILRGEDRLSEIFTLLGHKRLQDRLRRPVNKDLIDLIHRALADLEDPESALLDHLKDKSPAQSRWISSVLINALLRHRTPDAIEVLRRSIGLGVEFSPVEMSHFATSLKNAGMQVELQEISEILPGSMRNRFEILRRLQTASEARRREDLEDAWSELSSNWSPTRSETFAYAQGLANLGLVDLTRSVLTQVTEGSLDRNFKALALLHTAYAAASDVDMTCEYLDRIIAIRPSIAAFNRTLAVLAAHGDLTSAVELFDSILDHGLKPDRASFTNLISLFANRRDQENAQNVFDAMIIAGIKPDAVTWAALLNSYVESGDWNGAAILFESVPLDIKADRNVATTVLKALVLLASPTDRILRIFRSLSSPDKYNWALVIQSAADNGDLLLTKDLYDEMEAASLSSPDAPKPGVHIYSILLHAYLRRGYAESAREVYDEMLQQGIVPSSVTYGMVVASFSRLSEARSMTQAQAFAEDIYRQAKRERRFEAARSRGTLEENLFGPLLAASARDGSIDDAVSHFSAATASTESIPMYSQLMDAYRRAGNADSVLEIWKKVLQYAISQTTQRISSSAAFTRTRQNDNMICIPLSITLDALSQAGRYFDIKQVWADTAAAGFGFDSQNYNHYAAALARTGDIESAFSIVDRVILPKWDEIRNRRIAALREQKQAARALLAAQAASLPSESSTLDSEESNYALTVPGVSVPPAFRPPNRRDENRWDHVESLNGSSTSTGTLAMLEKWRPSDAYWRPSRLTISVLEHAYRQLEEVKRRSMWMALPADREDDVSDGTDGEGEGEGQAQITFPSFNNVPLRDQHGKPRKESAGMMLVKLNRRYLRVVSLITLHRRKQRAREAMERRSNR